MINYHSCRCFLFPLQVEMVRTRDVQCLSFPLTITTLLTSTSWVLYGLQLKDCYIVVRWVNSHLNPTRQHWNELPLTPCLLPVCVHFRSRTHPESSPASSDFICFGNLDRPVKACPPISPCIYECVMGTMWGLHGGLQESSPCTCLVLLISHGVEHIPIGQPLTKWE